MTDKFDVIVVGARRAGSPLATPLARQGLRVVEVTRQLQQHGRSQDLWDVLRHRRAPSAVFTPPVLLKAAASTMRRPGADRGRILREVRDLIATDSRRRRLNPRPEFVPITEHQDAGETDVPEEVAA